MLWPSYLNAVSKKSNLPRTLLYVFLLSLLFPLDLRPLETTYLPTAEPRSVQILACLTPGEVSRLQEALKDGYRSEISFTLRIYEARKTVFFGDTLLYEAQHTYTAWWDPVGREYLLATPSGEQFHHPFWEQFYSRYTHSPLFRLPALKGMRMYTTCQVVLKPQLFNPPLQILNSVGQSESIASSWLRMDWAP